MKATVITAQKLQDVYKMRIKRNFLLEINKYIGNSEVQEFVKKAMNCELTKADKMRISELDRKSKTYKHLYWLCCIYIHPLTIAQGILVQSHRITN